MNKMLIVLTLLFVSYCGTYLYAECCRDCCHRHSHYKNDEFAPRTRRNLPYIANDVKKDARQTVNQFKDDEEQIVRAAQHAAQKTGKAIKETTSKIGQDLKEGATKVVKGIKESKDQK